MSGRVIVDDVEAGDPLIYASNQRVEAWHRFGVRFADGGSFMLRDPRRLGAVELDPDESRLGPDALTFTLEQLDHALDARTAPVKAVLMDQARIAGLGNLLVDEALWRAGIDPVHLPVRSRSRRAQEVAPRDPRHGTGARPARWEPHGRHAARSGRGVPARRHAVAAANRRRAHDVLVSGSPTLKSYDRRMPVPSSSGPNDWCCGRGAKTTATPFAALNADPEVMRYFPAPLTRAESDAMVDAIMENFDRRGWGLWAVEVGRGPVRRLRRVEPRHFDAAFTPCVEVGWRLAKEHWGQGFASEGARAAVRYGFEVVGLDQILSWTATATCRRKR